jgi:hypothetical protein
VVFMLYYYYILYYYTYTIISYYILYYYTIIYYYPILYSSSSIPPSSPQQSYTLLFSSLLYSFYTCRYLHILIYILLPSPHPLPLIPIIPLPILLLFSSHLSSVPSSSSSHSFYLLVKGIHLSIFRLNGYTSISKRNNISIINSFYTCRYLHILIYILSSFPNLTPHVLSEWMVEV